MKVCIIHSIFPPYGRGGAETVAYASAAVFAQEHEVLVITCAPFAGWKSFAGKWEVEVSRYEDNQVRRYPMRIFRFTPLNLFTIFNIGKYPALLRLIWHVIDMFNLHTYLVVRRILQEEKPDVILTHNLKGLGYTVPIAIRHTLHAIRSMRWLHTIHDMALLHPTGLRIWGQEKDIALINPIVRLYERVNRKLFGSPECVISPSQFLLAEYTSRGFFPKSKTAVVRNPAMLHNPPQPSLTLREGDRSVPPLRVRGGEPSPQRGEEGLRFRFLYLGQLEPYKGIQVLLDAWRVYSAQAPQAELVIAGDGSMRETVVNACAMLARVRYAGWVDTDARIGLMSGVHAAIVSSYAYENSPTVIGESFAFGIPVVASRIGGIPELVEDGVNGLLITPNDVAALKDAMARMERDWKQLRDGACSSREVFSIETYKTKLESLVC